MVVEQIRLKTTDVYCQKNFALTNNSNYGGKLNVLFRYYTE